MSYQIFIQIGDRKEDPGPIFDILDKQSELELAINYYNEELPLVQHSANHTGEHISMVLRDTKSGKNLIYTRLAPQKATVFTAPSHPNDRRL